MTIFFRRVFDKAKALRVFEKNKFVVLTYKAKYLFLSKLGVGYELKLSHIDGDKG